jgi:NAD(P)H-hydrate epimerase
MTFPPAFKAAILTVAQMYQADQLAIASGIPGWSLMQAAGAAVAQEALALCRRGQTVVVLCGPGNNGGDGFVVATRLRAAGRRVCVMASGDPAGLQGDAALACAQWLAQPGAEVWPLSEAPLQGAALVIDALFGAGLNRPPQGIAAQLIGFINQHRIPCVAVDVPSGVAGDSGQILGEAPQATTTVCFFRPKPGHYLYPGKARCGRLVVADIGIPESVLATIAPQLFLNGPALWRLPVPGWCDHKYSRGHVTVWGSAEMSGAGRLAIRGARRVGAGLVTAAIPRAAMAIYTLDAPGALMAPLSDDPAQALEDFAALLADPRRSVLLIGPGAVADAHSRALVLRALKEQVTGGRAVVLDAGALSAFATKPEELFQAISAAREWGAAVVITPHDGEFSRLFPDLSAAGGASRLQRAVIAAARSGAVMVLKGPDTVVATAQGWAAVAPFTAADLATGGSGDVLAGMIAGFLGQGMGAVEAACCAVWIHSEAGRRLGAGLIAEDLPQVIPQILADLR